MKCSVLYKQVKNVQYYALIQFDTCNFFVTLEFIDTI